MTAFPLLSTIACIAALLFGSSVFSGEVHDFPAAGEVHVRVAM